MPLGAWPCRPAATAVIETIAILTFAAFESASVRLWLCAAGDERWQSVDFVASRWLHRRLWLRAMIALFAILIALLLIRLRFPRLELWLLLLRRRGCEPWFSTEIRIALAFVAVVGLRVVVLAFGPRRLLRLTLAELLLRRRDQTKIMFGVLIVILCRYWIA